MHVVFGWWVNATVTIVILTWYVRLYYTIKDNREQQMNVEH